MLKSLVNIPLIVGRFFFVLLWEPLPKRSKQYLDAKEWGDNFRKEYLNVAKWSEDQKNAAEFLFERALADMETAEKSSESLRNKCLDLLRMNTAIVVGIFALIRYFSTSANPMYLAIASVVGLLIAIAAVISPLKGLPYIAGTSVRHLAKWEASGDLTASIQYNAITFCHRAVQANLHVNHWVSTRLAFASFVTFCSLCLLAAQLFCTG